MAALSAYIHEAIRNLATNPKAAAAAIGGGATAYAGTTALTYNKDNFMIDEGNRFGRFTTARANMMAQVGQYRFDIRGLANITITKAHIFLDTAQLFMCTSAALTCAGRIGMHGSAPPGWLCALYTGNIFLGMMYLTLCMWLGFHATLRAQCGMVSLLTRKVRLPVPSLAQINNARVFGSTYEKQRWWDILRFPWVPHPYDQPEIPGESSDEEGDASGKKGKKAKGEKGDRRAGDYAASQAFGSTGRASVPSWIRDEQVVDKGCASVPHHVAQFPGDVQLNDTNDPHDAPDHFKLFTEAQKEWFPYEVYHKVALLYGVCCFFHAICYYCVITAMSELRGFWIAWSLPGIFMTAQYWLLQLDIFQAKGQQYLRNFELFGHFAPYFATMACTCEFRAQYSKAQVGVAWTFALASLASHMLFGMRLFDLMTPDTQGKEQEDQDGKSWWPRSWPVPLAFANTLWQLTPPKKLKKGHHDLLHEAINLERQRGGVGKVRKRHGKDAKRTKRGIPQSPAALKHHVDELDRRFRSVQQYVVGRDQAEFNTLYGRMVAHRFEAQKLGSGGGDSSGSEDAGSDGYATYLNTSSGTLRHSQFVDKLVEIGAELNIVEDALADFERNHQVPLKPGASIALDPNGGEIDGTSTRPLPQTPYWIMRAATSTHIFVWFFILCCTVAEICLGQEAVLVMPGEPPWIRNQKYRPWNKQKEYLHLSTDPLPDWYRLFVSAEIPPPVEHGAHGAAAGGHGAAASHGGHRRLGSEGEAVFDNLFKTLPALDWLAEKYLNEDNHGISHVGSQAAMQASLETAGMPKTLSSEVPPAGKTTSVPMGGFMTPSLRTVPVEWPSLFEPRHLACQTRATGTAIAAITSRGVGALLQMKNYTDGRALGSLSAERFALSGIAAMGPLVGSSWGASGLHLVTKAGKLLHCPGHAPRGGAWACQETPGTPLPMSPGSMLRAGVVHEHATMGRTVALLFENMPKTVVLYKEDDSKSWRPAGEMHLPPNARRAGLSFDNDSLMLVAEDGAVHHRPVREGVAPAMVPPPASSLPREWHSACEGGAIRLALRQAATHAASSWRPELVVDANFGSSTPLVNV